MRWGVHVSTTSAPKIKACRDQKQAADVTNASFGLFLWFLVHLRNIFKGLDNKNKKKQKKKIEICWRHMIWGVSESGTLVGIRNKQEMFANPIQTYGALQMWCALNTASGINLSTILHSEKLILCKSLVQFFLLVVKFFFFLTYRTLQKYKCCACAHLTSNALRQLPNS